MRAVDRIIEKLPGYAEMRGQVSDEAIIAHAATVYPTTTAIAVTEAEIESEGFGLFGIGDIFNVAKKAISTVIKVGKGVVKGVAKEYKLAIERREPQPTAAQVAAAVAKEKDKSKAKPSWILPAIIAVVVAVVIVLVVSLTGKAK